MSSFGGYSTYGNMFGYVLGAGAPIGMPAGSLNQNAFIMGAAASYLGSTTLTRRGVSAYSSLSFTSDFAARISVPGSIACGACIGPARAFFPNSAGRTYGPPSNVAVSPY